MDGALANRPAWQTDDLADEWPDEDERTHSTKQRTISTQATNTQKYNGSLNFASLQRTGSVRSVGTTGRGGAGTFVVREDEPPMQVMPQTPGKQKKGGMRTMFTPLAIEKMFEPPSPPEQTTPLSEPEPGPSKPITPPLGLFTHNSTRPSVPSKLSQAINASFTTTTEGEEGGDGDEILETDMPNMGGFGGKKPGANCMFTFAVDRHQVAPLPVSDGKLQPLEQEPQAQSTPIPPSNSQLLAQPPTDPRLRLFHFQYDTYTRGHLSALVDSFAVSPQSGSSHSNDDSTPLKLPASSSAEKNERDGDESFSRFRSTKRIRLTPTSQLGDDGASFQSNAHRRVATKKDYLGESRNLMQQIKRARDVSMASAATQNQAELSRIEEISFAEEQKQPLQPRDTNAYLRVPPERPPSSASTSLSSSANAKGSKYSSLAIRAQAEDLMTKIKRDMKSNRRLFSERTEKSYVSDFEEEPGRSSAPSPEQVPIVRVGTPHSDVDYDKENNVAPPPYAPDSSHDRPSYNSKRSGKSTSATIQSPEKLNFFVQSQFGRDQRPIVMPVEIPIVTDFSRGLSPADDRVRSPNPTFLAPPRLTTTVSTNDDLNRFVSSSSTATGTTLNGGGSTGSFVKHAGAPHMVHIGPEDLPKIPDRVGKMIYDHDLMRWVKERQASHEAKVATAGVGNTEVASPSVVEGESDDPFRDIESLRDDDSSRRSLVYSPDVPQSPRLDASVDMILDNGSETDDSAFGDPEDAHLSSFTFDDPASGVVQVMTGASEDEEGGEMEMCHDIDTSDSDFDELPPFDPNASELTDDMASMSLSQMQNGSFAISASFSPGRGNSIAFDAQVTVTPMPSEKRPLRPPRSALKSASATPVSRIVGSGHTRSVSFSDGRKDGKILGLTHDISHVTPSASFMPSARTKRIANMLMDIETSEYNFPSKGSHNGRQMVPSIRHPDEDISELSLQQQASPSKRLFERSHSVHDIRHTASPRKNVARSNANGTFLTECSFGVAHDRLVQVITDVQPFEPYWEELNTIDLSRRRLDSVARLKEFLPKLDSINLNENLLNWLSGVPGGVRTLSVASNALSSLTSFAHLPNLECVDISNNDIDSLESLRCLRHLRELRADGNRIQSLSGLEELGALVKLSLQGNELAEFDASSCQWSRLEMLNLSCNKLTSVTGLEGLTALISINLDNNALVSLDSSPNDWTSPKGRDHHAPKNHTSSALTKLRILKLSGNRLRYLNAGRFPNLRTLYLDNNCLAEAKNERQRLVNLHRLGKLENFSARNQSGGNGRDSGLRLQSADVCDAKRLYLSGNPYPLPLGPSAQPCYNLIYLELAACRLTKLPSNFSALAPNLRVLNLNYNFLESADEVALSLSGLKRLRKLTLVGSRMTGTKPLIRMLGAMGENLELIDFRMNPCTLGWYLPLLVHDKDAPGALLQPSEFTTAAMGKTSDGSKQARGGNDEDAVYSHGTASSEIGVVAAGSHDAASSGARIRSDAPGMSEKASATSPAKDGPSRWEALDAEFRKGLPDAAYVGRLAYRGMVMRACPNLRVLDGVRVSEKERRKAEALLKRVLVDMKTRTHAIAAGQ
ncbi:L domain-like protein [Schizopora paradoxa]|uniref:L domain-like protein n=1 Tax=Schizopora paradoxa TaxID=27342 RepID=A0A0H2S6K7_9AGAM|nr:L domain-like protein [Schizopora paradoxa]